MDNQTTLSAESNRYAVGSMGLFEVSGTELAVCNDIASRQAKGISKYGMTVSENPAPLRDWLQHAYEETLDKAVYLRRAIDAIDSSNDKLTHPESKP